MKRNPTGPFIGGDISRGDRGRNQSWFGEICTGNLKSAFHKIYVLM